MNLFARSRCCCSPFAFAVDGDRTAGDRIARRRRWRVQCRAVATPARCGVALLLPGAVNFNLAPAHAFIAPASASAKRRADRRAARR